MPETVPDPSHMIRKYQLGDWRKGSSARQVEPGEENVHESEARQDVKSLQF